MRQEDDLLRELLHQSFDLPPLISGTICLKPLTNSQKSLFIVNSVLCIYLFVLRFNDILMTSQYA